MRAWRLWRQHRGYRALLVRIERLERELFPEWFVSDAERMYGFRTAHPLSDYSLAPGTRWLVDDHRDISFAHSGLMYSALRSASQ